jgi:hypothetical protein
MELSSLTQNVLIVLLVLFVIYIIINWIYKSTTTLSGIQKSNVPTIVSSSALSNNGTSNYTYSTWFYINSWSSTANNKRLIYRGAPGFSSFPSNGSAPMTIASVPEMFVCLGDTTNDIYIYVKSTTNTLSSTSITPTDLLSSNNCIKVSNFPIQKWVNLILSVNGIALDVYIDGKLYTTTPLSAPASVIASNSIYITPYASDINDGFTANFQYIGSSINPQEAFNIYKKGFGGSGLGDLFNKYRLKLSFLQDNVETAGIEI